MPLSCSKDDTWYFDTGATNHLTHRKDWLQRFEPLRPPILVRFGNNGTKPAIGKGEITFELTGGRHFTINGVFYVPGITKHLLSVSQATINGAIIEFHPNHAIIKHKNTNGDLIRTCCKREGGLYPLKCVPMHEAHTAVTHEKSPNLTLLWHSRMGHMHLDALKTLQSHNLVDGIPKQPFQPISVCQSCLLGKMPQQRFPKSQGSRSTCILDLVHSDICGPLPTPSLTGARYFVTFIDDFSRFTILYFLKEKSGAFQAFQSYKAFVELQTSSRLKALQTDGGGEYNSHKFLRIYREEGIRHQLSTPYTPQQNGLSERKNRSLLNMARSMLQLAGLSHKFWEEAVGTACYIQNRGFHRSLGMTTPFELWHGHKPNLDNLRIFGCIAFAFVPEVKRNKLDARATKSIFIGYGEANGYKAYKLFNPTTQRIFFSRSVVFQEDTLLSTILNSPTHPSNLSFPPDKLPPLLLPTPPITFPSSTTHSKADQSSSQSLDSTNSTTITLSLPFRNQANVSSPSNVPLKLDPNKTIHSSPPSFTYLPITPSSSPCNFPTTPSSLSPTPPPKFRSLDSIYEELDQMEAHFVDINHGEILERDDNVISTDDIVLSAKEALAGPESEKWRNAMEDEMESLRKTGTWTLVEPPNNRQIISSKWVLRIKKNATGEPVRFKARVVARGFSQVPGIDFKDTFSPTLKIIGFRMLVGLAALHDLELHHLDVQTAFLHGELSEEIYMQQPPFFEDPSNPHHVCRLQKSIYGLKQSPRVWYHKLHSFLMNANYDRLKNEPNIYIRKTDNTFVIIGVYVDDIPLISNSKLSLNLAKTELASTFPITDLGPMTQFLGIQVLRNRTNHTISLSQSQYIDTILKRFDMLHCKPINTPMTVPCKLSLEDIPSNDRKRSQIEVVPYKQVLGCV